MTLSRLRLAVVCCAIGVTAGACGASRSPALNADSAEGRNNLHNAIVSAYVATKTGPRDGPIAFDPKAKRDFSPYAWSAYLGYPPRCGADGSYAVRYRRLPGRGDALHYELRCADGRLLDRQ